MEKQYINCKIQKADNGDLTIVASDETVDRMGEVVPIDAWDLGNYKKNPVLLVDHDYKVSNIVGRAKNIKIDGKSLTFTPEFHDITQLAKEVRAMVESDFAPAVSVGFLPHGAQKDGGKIKNELLEISFVSVPANPNALALAMKGINDVQVKEISEWVEKEVTDDATDQPEITAEVKTVTMSMDLYDSIGKQIDELATLKEGRVISGKNRTKILDCSNALKQVAALLDDLLETTTSGEKDGDELNKGREVELVKEQSAKVATPNASAVLRALQDINKTSNVLLSQLKK